MKILQGPGEQGLAEFVGLNFKTMQKVKPAASRNASAETYYFCQGYDQSMDPRAIKLRDFKQKLEHAEGNPHEQDRLMSQLQEEKLEQFREMLEQGHRYGLEVPDEMKAIVKTHFKGQVDVDNKMSRRDKAKALAKLKKDSD